MKTLGVYAIALQLWYRKRQKNLSYSSGFKSWYIKYHSSFKLVVLQLKFTQMLLLAFMSFLKGRGYRTVYGSLNLKPYSITFC